MLQLNEFFDNLSYGELANVSLGNSDTGLVPESAYPLMVSHINLGMTALHRRFFLRAGEVAIQQYSGISKYYLRTQFAQTNVVSAELVKYILDTPSDPFIPSILKIKEVFDELGAEFRINDVNADFPIYTPAYDTLILSPSVNNPIFFITYHANHPKIVVGENFDPEQVTLEIPEWAVLALQYFVADRVFSGRMYDSDQVNQTGKSNLAYRYEQECVRLERDNMDADENDTHNRLEDKGWV